MKLYIVEKSPSQNTGKSSFYKVLSDIYRHMYYSSLCGIYYCVKGTLCDIIIRS